MKSKPIILVVEDDTLVASTLKEILIDAGYEVAGACNGREAVDMIETRITPDLVLSDIRMPSMNGYELLGFVRSRPQLEEVPFIFLSAKSASSDIRTGLALGADDYIPKPFNPDDALKSIKVRLERAARLQSSKKQQGEYLMRYLPHEILTPLTGIMGFADLMREQAQSGTDLSRADTLEYANSLLLCGNRLLLLTENLTLWLDLNQKVNARALRREEFPLIEYWREELTLAVQHRAEHYGRKRDLILDLAPCALPIPDNYIQRIAIQLVDNACKFSLPGSSIEISGKLKDHHYILTFADSGRGMSPEQIAHIGLFQQFDRSTNEQQGLGLGLAICGMFAAYANARFEITPNSDRPGVSASFYFTASSS